MTRPFVKKIHGLTLLFFLCLFSCNPKKEFGEWTLQQKAAGATLYWTGFSWSQQEWGGKVYEKAAMLIPVKVKGLHYSFTFQFDLGSNLTMLHGKTLQSLLVRHPDFNRSDGHAFDELTLFLIASKHRQKTVISSRILETLYPVA